MKVKEKTMEDGQEIDPMEELHWCLVAALQRVAQGLSTVDDAKLLCWATAIDERDIVGAS